MNKVTAKPTEHAIGKDFYVWSIHQVHIRIDHDCHIAAIISYNVNPKQMEVKHLKNCIFNFKSKPNVHN